MIRDNYGSSLPHKHDLLAWKCGVFFEEDIEDAKDIINRLSVGILEAEDSEDAYEIRIDTMKAYMIYIAIIGFFAGLFIGGWCMKLLAA